LYEAIRDFLDEADITIGERQKELRELEESLFVDKDEFDRVNNPNLSARLFSNAHYL
jgi:hypothetical protein